jgi:hypothetical protein
MGKNKQIRSGPNEAVLHMHRTHHSTQRNEHDSNYGAVLSLWDRLFGTLTELKPAEIGINGNSPQDLVNLIKFGFTLPTPPSVQTINLDAMIAEAAYYKAEKRGFYPGNDIQDWLEAKRDIIALVYGDTPVKNNPTRKLQCNYFKFINLNMNHKSIVYLRKSIITMAMNKNFNVPFLSSKVF